MHPLDVPLARVGGGSGRLREHLGHGVAADPVGDPLVVFCWASW